MVAVGDKLDVSGNDLLAWWEDDERTDVIVLSLASYGNPRRFRPLAPRVSRRQADRRPGAHGRAGRRRAAGAARRASGVDDFDGMLDVARLLAWQPVPTGERVAVVAEPSGRPPTPPRRCRAAA